MIVEKIMEAKERKRRLWPVNTNRASELGHPCLRYLTYVRTRGEEKSLPSVELQHIFDLGNAIEDLVLRELDEAGLKVIEQQRSFDWKEYLITGHIDGKVLIDGYAAPMEIKSISPYLFNQIDRVQDMTKSKYLHLRKYPAQLTLYLLMDNKEWGLFLFKNKTSGQYKEVRVDLDYQLGECLLKKAEAINKHVSEKTLPEPIEYDPMACDDCSFGHVCNIERVGTEVEIVDDAELAAMLNRLDEIKPVKKEYDQIDKLISERVKNRPKVLIGDFLITGSARERKGYTVEPCSYWSKEITKAI